MEAERQDRTQGSPSERRRTRVVRPYPIHTLEAALSVATAIQESNAGLAFDRVLLAGALGTTPASSGYTLKLNAAAKYGLTHGGYNDDSITLTPLGEAIVAPKRRDESRTALFEAAMHPDLFRRFYHALDGKRLPEDEYAQNMLQRELGVHPELTGECLGIIKANGVYVDILKEEGGSYSVSLGRPDVGDSMSGAAEADSSPRGDRPRHSRIFIGDCGSAGALRFVKEVMEEFGIAYGLAERETSDAQPIPSQVSSEMRNCTAAVLVFANEHSGERSGTPSAGERALYQLGAASALYGDRIVILKESGLELPHDIAAVHSVPFDSERPGDAAFGLLRELHRVGAIKVSG